MNTLYNNMITPPQHFPKVGPNSLWGINEDGFNKDVNERDATTEAKKPVMILPFGKREQNFARFF
jgi:hypothetical protein